MPTDTSQARWPTPGDRIGEFEVVDQIGTGSFSKVYLAIQTTVGSRKVVLKLTTEKQNEPDWLGRFQHENIVPVYSVHRWKEFHVLCMPFWGTLTLAAWMRQQPNSRDRSALLLAETLNSAKHKLPSTLVDNAARLTKDGADKDWNGDSTSEISIQQRAENSIETAISLFHRLASALRHSHSQNVLHGDLKPANVLIRSDGGPALLDFNLSQDTSQGSTRVKGSTPYMAPEQLVGWRDGKPIMTQATDLYALGLMLYEFLTGSLPEVFRVSVTPETLDATAKERFSFDFARTLGDIPVGLKSIVLKALQPTIEERYATAAEFEEDLEREASQRRLAFAEDPRWNRCRKFFKRNKNAFSVTSIIATACCICLFTSVSLWQWRRVALKHEALQSSIRFLSQSQNLLGRLHSVDGSMDGQVADRLIRLSQEFTPVLFGKSSDAAWNWLGVDDKQRLVDGLGQHVLMTSYAAQRSSRLEDAIAREAWLQICRSLPSEFATFADDATILVSEPTIAKNIEQMDASLKNPFLLATIAGEHRDWGRAQAFLDRVPESERTTGLYWLLLGRCQLMLDDLEGAVLSFGLSAERTELKALSRFDRGRTYLKQRRAAKAIEEFSQAIQESSDFLDAYVQRSIAYEMLGKWENALADLNRVIEFEPYRTTARSIRARVLENLERKQEAKEDQQLILTIEPKRSTDWTTRALNRLPQDVNGAWDDLCRAQELDPLQPMVWQNKAYVASEFRKDEQLAVRQLDELLRLSSCDIEALSGRAVLNARLENDEQAIADIEKALRLKTGRGGPTHYHACCVFSILSERNADLVQRAHTHLAKSLQFGYGLDIVENDLDLNSIRNTPSFREIVRVAKLANHDPSSTSSP
jgi:serine/threonine protein kinase/tetratricopeptide (TPR) repeat protein